MIIEIDQINTYSGFYETLIMASLKKIHQNFYKNQFFQKKYASFGSSLNLNIIYRHKNPFAWQYLRTKWFPEMDSNQKLNG